MLIFANTRKSGKTTEAIILASSTQSLLVVPREEMVESAERLAREINRPVMVISAEKYFNNLQINKRTSTQRVIIDEIDSVLRVIFGADVIMATTTGFIQEFKEVQSFKIEDSPSYYKPIKFTKKGI